MVSEQVLSFTMEIADRFLVIEKGKFVVEESRDKVESLLRDAEEGVPTRWRQVNHPVRGHDDLPLSYAVVQPAGAALQP